MQNECSSELGNDRIQFTMSERPQLGITATFETDAVVETRQTAHTRVEYILTRYHGAMVLMDGEVQSSSIDEHRYHELLVHPAMQMVSDPHIRVLVLGGGDGFAAKQLLKWKCVESITIVDYDQEFVQCIARKHLNPFICDEHHERVSIRYENALTYTRNTGDRYNLIVIDLPDPDESHFAQLYLDLLYSCQRILLPRGILVTHVGPVSLHPKAPCWSFLRALRSTARNLYGGCSFHFRVGYIPSFVHPWGFFAIVPMGATASPAGESISVQQCRFWNPRLPEHRLDTPTQECIGDKDFVYIYSSEVQCFRE